MGRWRFLASAAGPGLWANSGTTCPDSGAQPATSWAPASTPLLPLVASSNSPSQQVSVRLSGSDSHLAQCSSSSDIPPDLHFLQAHRYGPWSLWGDLNCLPGVLSEQPACWGVGRKEERLEAPGRGEVGGHTVMLSSARQPLQNQEQMAGRFPNPSFGSDCPGEKGFELPGGGEGITFHP